MGIKTHTPQISVEVFKTPHPGSPVRPSASVGVIDLSPYLNEGSSVSTHKGINDPNGGFTIRLYDQIVERIGEWIYACIEPMDAIEIRMSRVGQPVMVMRGMVTDVSLDESVEGGKTQRTVTITGSDYGGFLRMIQIHFVKGTDIADLMYQLTEAYLQTKFGIPYIALTAGAYVIYMVGGLGGGADGSKKIGVVNNFIDELNNSGFSQLRVDVSGADSNDMVFPYGVQTNPQGTMWSQFLRHGNLGPFYEAFFDDMEAATTLVYRKPAFRKLGTAEYIFPTTSAETITVEPEEVLAMQKRRSERDVANFFLVRAPRGDFMTPQDVILQSIRGDTSLLLADTPNCDKKYYGFRSLEVDTQHGNFDFQLVPGQEKAQSERGAAGFSTYMLEQIRYLKECNIDNSVFESGSVRCQGRPEYRPGRYIEIAWRSGVKFSAYVTAVTHTFEPLKAYTCTLQFSRGEEWVNRKKVDQLHAYGKGAYE